MTTKLTKSEMHEAVADGVERAMWRMITGITDMPSHDFWDTLKAALERAFVKISEDEIERRNDGS